MVMTAGWKSLIYYHNVGGAQTPLCVVAKVMGIGSGS